MAVQVRVDIFNSTFMIFAYAKIPFSQTRLNAFCRLEYFFALRDCF